MADRCVRQKIYLCQVSETLSCGACCGLYNVADPSRRGLEVRLARRTAEFARTPRNRVAIDAFGWDRTGWRRPQGPLNRFHHCPFLGLIGTQRQRVGCLLHPNLPENAGYDWRGLSYYGGKACRSYLCPSARRLRPAWLHSLQQALDHWYPYGLIVTERRLLTAFFVHLEALLGRAVRMTDVKFQSAAASRLKALADLKITWPHRRHRAPGVCNFFFENGEYLRPSLKLPAAPPPRPNTYDIMFRELDSEFASQAALQAAIERLDGLFEPLAACLKA